MERNSPAFASAIPHDDAEEGSAEISKTTELAPETSDRMSCHLVERVVDFKDDLGFNFITHPATINLGQCVGACPMYALSTRYDYFMNYLRSRVGGKDIETDEPCCVPTEYGDVDVVVRLYNQETKNFELRIDRIEQATVTKCGCR